MKIMFGELVEQGTMYLEGAICNSNVEIYSPVRDTNSCTARIKLTGDEFHIQILREVLQNLVRKSLRKPYLGRWIGVVPCGDSDNTIEVHYEKGSSNVNMYGLLTFALREHMITECNLMLATWSVFSVKLGNKRKFSRGVPLPKHMNNGSVLLPLIMPAHEKIQ